MGNEIGGCLVGLLCFYLPRNLDALYWSLRAHKHLARIFGWRRQFRDGTAKGDIGSASFVPLAIAASSGEAGGIELIYGGVTIRPGAGFDAGELRRVLQVVRGLP